MRNKRETHCTYFVNSVARPSIICEKFMKKNEFHEKVVKVCVLRVFTARVILGQVLSIVTCGIRTHTVVTACDQMPNHLTYLATQDLRKSSKKTDIFQHNW